MQRLPLLRFGESADCSRCGRSLAGAGLSSLTTALAFSLGSLLLLVPATALPLLSVSSYGMERTAYLWSNVSAYWNDGFASLAWVVAVFCIIAPYVYLGLFVVALVGLRYEPRKELGTVFRWVKHLRLWTMLDVFLVGGFVAYGRLNAVAHVQVEIGGWFLIASTFALLFAMTQFDEREVWALLPHPVAEVSADRALACTTCDLVVDGTRFQNCPRCAAHLAFRKPASFEATAALVIAGFLLYIPANLLPVLTITRLGGEQGNTIMGGVLELIDSDLLPLAILVFVASIVLPVLKLTGLSWMLLATRLKSNLWLLERTRFYRLVDAVGRWSNIDVYLGSVLAALLQFGNLTTIKPENGLVAFAAVVVLTMIATSVFDARLMWDAAAPQR